MAKIIDTGKVWIKGNAKPDYALRVDKNIFVPGKEADDEINCWVEGEFLCVDLLDRHSERRVARKFPLKAEGTAPATLFSGFAKTKHADVLAVCPHTAGVEEHIFQGEDYNSSRIYELDCRDFWKQKAFPEN